MTFPRTNWVAWLVLGHFTDIDPDEAAPDQPTGRELQYAGELAMAVSGSYTQAAMEAGSTKQIAIVVAQLIRSLAEDDGDYETLVADELVDIAQVFETW